MHSLLGGCGGVSRATGEIPAARAAIGYLSIMPSLTAPATVLLCYCSCPDAASAQTLAETLVEERLAACVSRLPGVHSTYRWQGRVTTDSEELLLIKTTADRFEALRTRLLELHPLRSARTDRRTGGARPCRLPGLGARQRQLTHATDHREPPRPSPMRYGERRTNRWRQGIGHPKSGSIEFPVCGPYPRRERDPPCRHPNI